MSWKDVYEGTWERGSDRVEYVEDQLRTRFPKLTIKRGYGAIERGRIPEVPHEMHEANLRLLHKSLTIVDIEVSGSDIKMKPPYGTIWILQGKYKKAIERKRRENIETWFFMVYIRNDYVLDIGLVKKFKDNVWIECPHGPPEPYIHIPCKEAYPKEKLFKWIAKQIK